MLLSPYSPNLIAVPKAFSEDVSEFSDEGDLSIDAKRSSSSTKGAKPFAADGGGSPRKTLERSSEENKRHFEKNGRCYSVVNNTSSRTPPTTPPAAGYGYGSNGREKAQQVKEKAGGDEEGQGEKRRLSIIKPNSKGKTGEGGDDRDSADDPLEWKWASSSSSVCYDDLNYGDLGERDSMRT